MSNRSSQFEPLDVEDAGALRTHYEAIRQWLIEQSDLDIRHHLPNLVETLVDGSENSDTVRFVGGVSFTQKHTPLDYRLDRVYAPEEVDFHRRESMKLPVSRDHHYVRFVYPPDPKFDAAALRAVLLSAVETTLQSVEDADEDRPVSGLSSLWQDL